MVRSAGSKSCLVFLVLLLRECPWAAERPLAASTDAPSLCYNFTITPNRQPWCEVQGQVNGNTFLIYTCSSKMAEPIGPLGMKVNATGAWKTQTETLKDLTEELKKALPDIKPEIITTIDFFSLQGRFMCPWEANGSISGSWEFGFDGQRFLLFDLENRKYTVDHPGGERMKEKWEHDKDLTMTSTSIPVSVCKEWRDEFLVYWKEELPTTAPPTVVPATTQSKATTTSCIFSVVFLPCLITIGILFHLQLPGKGIRGQTTRLLRDNRAELLLPTSELDEEWMWQSTQSFSELVCCYQDAAAQAPESVV